MASPDNERLPFHAAPAPSAERLRWLHHAMARLRAMDEVASDLARDGHLPSSPRCEGLEALLTGIAGALEERDWVLPSPRFSPIALLRGVATGAWLGQLLGRSSDPSRGRQEPGSGAWRTVRVMSPSGLPGAHLPIAAGVARAMRLAGRGEVAVAVAGSGAVAGGDFHVGLNFAAVGRSPAVFVIATTPALASQTATRVAIKARAYGMPGVTVDGGDALAVEQALRDALARARGGDGPALIEATCPSREEALPASGLRLVGDDGAAAWEEADPLARLEREMVRRGVLDEVALHDLRVEVRGQASVAAEEALRVPAVGSSLLFDDVFARLTPALRRQRAEWLAARSFED